MEYLGKERISEKSVKENPNTKSLVTAQNVTDLRSRDWLLFLGLSRGQFPTSDWGLLREAKAI